MNLLDAQLSALQVFDRAVRRVSDDQWLVPVHGTDWTVRDVVALLTRRQLWVPHLLRGETSEEVGDRYDGDVLGEDPLHAWETAATAAREAWRAEDAIDQRVHPPDGTASADDYGWQLTTDLTVHGWDIARALRIDPAVPGDLAATVDRCGPHVDRSRAVVPGPRPIPMCESVPPTPAPERTDDVPAPPGKARSLLAALPRRHELRTAQALITERVVVGMMARRGDPSARVLSPRGLPDPYPEYARIRTLGPVFRSKLGPFFTARHGVATSVLRSTDNWSSLSGAAGAVMDWDAAGLAHPFVHSLLALNPPDHTRLRRVVAPWFTPRAVSRWEENITNTVHEFLDRGAERGQFDLATEFATRVPIRVICNLMGVDDSRHADFARWGEVLGATVDGVRSLAELRTLKTAVREMTDYFSALIPIRRANPGNDVLSGLVTSNVDLTPRDLIATAGLLLGAGFETTRNLIGNGMLALLRHPEQAELVRADPSLAGGMVEEVLRYDSPLQTAARVANHDQEIDGIPIGRGSLICVLLGGANQDPEIFDHPSSFDITRPNAREHLSFSAGAHFCLGAGLARLEAEIVLRELLLRFPNLHGAAPAQRRRSRVLRGLSSLPVDTGARTTVMA